MIKEIFFTADGNNNPTKLDMPWLQIPPIDSHSRSIDNKWLDTAGEMIEAILYGGPAKSSHGDEAMAEVISRYLTCLTSRATKLEQLLLVHLILYYLIYQAQADDAKPGSGWTEESRAAAIEKAEQILQASHWPGLIEAGLASPDNHLFYLANRAAYVLGIDTWNRHWDRLQVYPFDSYAWQNIIQRATPDNIDSVINFALQRLPLSQIATPADETEPDTKNQIYRALGTVVQALKDYPGVGWPLILACLKGPTVGNRDLALNVLATWGRSHWTSEIEAALVQAGAVESQKVTAAQPEEVLQVEPLT